MGQRHVDPQSVIAGLKQQLADEATQKHMQAALLADAEARVAKLEARVAELEAQNSGGDGDV